MKSIAFVTPWPPNVMGIGETCYALVKQLSLSSSWKFFIYTDKQNPVQIPGVTVETLAFQKNGRVDVAAAGRRFRQHDLIVHQMGNSFAHAFQWPLLEAYPAVCHFHDLIYHHFWVYYYFNFLKKPKSYFRNLFRFYPDLKQEFKGKVLPIWDLVDVNRYPFFELHAEKSLGAIVHSEYSQMRIKKAFPHLKVHKILLHKGNLDSLPSSRMSNHLNFGVFGSLLPNKQMDLILKTFAKLNLGFSNWTLTQVGSMDESCIGLQQKVKELGIEGKVVFRGKVEKGLYLQLLNQMDCCINLRYPSFGESSGVVTECLMAKIPVLVADLMWYSELPSFVDKISVGDLQNGLFATLRHYFLHPDSLVEKKHKMKAYASQYLCYDQWSKDYLQILSEFIK